MTARNWDKDRQRHATTEARQRGGRLHTFLVRYPGMRCADCTTPIPKGGTAVGVTGTTGWRCVRCANEWANGRVPTR